jgi:hypothetical protein
MSAGLRTGRRSGARGSREKIYCDSFYLAGEWRECWIFVVLFFFCNLVVGFSCWVFLPSGRLLLTAGVGAIYVDTRRTP